MLCGNCFKELNNETVCPCCGYDNSVTDKNPLALASNSILNGKFITGRVLGQGGFGITYLAVDHSTKEILAIKEYFPSELATRMPGTGKVVSISENSKDAYKAGQEGFLSEAKTLAQFRGNENIVCVHRYFEENGTAYLVMEYVNGEGLNKYMSRHGGRLSPDDANALLVPLMDALYLVHSKGVVHRDIAPDNILITKDGKAKLIDFGAARYSTGEKSKSLDVVLKHGFAPIEQYTRHGRQGPWTDVYAFAATYYYTVTGKVIPEAAARIEEDTILDPSTLCSGIWPELNEALMKGLRVRSVDRYQSMAEMKSAFDSAIEAENDRRAAEKKAEEERLAAIRRAEEARLAAKRKAEEERLAAEKKAEEERLAAAKKAEEERLAAEKAAEEKRLEKERKLQQKKLEEERRKAAQEKAAEERARKAEEKRLEKEKRIESKRELKEKKAGTDGGTESASQKKLIAGIAAAAVCIAAAAAVVIAVSPAGKNTAGPDTAKLPGNYAEVTAVETQYIDSGIAEPEETPEPDPLEEGYKKAVELYESGKYYEAIEAFEALDGYGDSEAQIKACKTGALSIAEAGNTVWFGTYEQDNDTSNGTEEIEWQVLEREGDRILVISSYAIESMPYNGKNEKITWENCTLRKWLNEIFLSSAFTEEEQSMIKETAVTADETDSGTDPGNDTTDRVFLLSAKDAVDYYGSEGKGICAMTEYAKQKGAYKDDKYKTADGESLCWWWLRSPGANQTCAAVVDLKGVVTGLSVNNKNYACVRPALWISPESLKDD